MIKDKIKKIKQYPYNFVSIDSKSVVEKGKRKLGKNTGKFSCVLTTRTPLFIMGESKQENGHTEENFYRENRITTIPASSLKGSIRNVIDVLTNSVIRNVDDTRLEQRKGAGEFSKAIFGIVKSLPTENSDGEIEEAIRIRVRTKDKEGKKIISDNGNLFSKKYNKNKPDGLIERIKLKESIYNLKEVEINSKVKGQLINDDFEYKKYLSNNEEGIQGVLWFSSPIHGKIYEKLLVPKKNGKIYKFSKEEYDDFEYIINQRAKRINNGKDSNSSTFYYDKKTDKPDKRLEVGDPLLFEVKNGIRVEHLAFSEIPRLRYKYSPLDLVPKQYLPSDSLEELSFSEKLFGTIGDNTEKEKKNKENDDKIVALAGRVFFGDAKNNEPKMIDNGKLVTLKAFGEPHPTLTTFYLDNINKDYNDKEGVYIRGRKFYWHHEDKIDKEFSSYRESIEMPKIKNKYGKYENKFAYNSSLELMDINNKFEFEVYFENLTDEELGVLIYGLELEDDLLHKIGKGKAFGFGSCKIEITKIELENKKRYESFYENKFEPDVDKLKYIKIAKDKYIIETKQYIKELKTILSKTNDLDFSKSPFPEEQKYNPRTSSYSGEKNTLNWFTNNKKIQLLRITDKNPEK